ncbi:hypothetical protein [Azonexus hydrophilus]|jgi:hypothetical protein|uniref:hypothetical protein n=1 Tax=Azonexus hydrophilus TaxID=418702 RepID=UPI001962C1D3|nr:hypothetical protein [Azonexus hydrophilus]
MGNLIGLLRELRLMKNQPSHRFYAACVLVFALAATGMFFRSFVLKELLLRLM